MGKCKGKNGTLEPHGGLTGIPPAYHFEGKKEGAGRKKERGRRGFSAGKKKRKGSEAKGRGVLQRFEREQTWEKKKPVSPIIGSRIRRRKTGAYLLASTGRRKNAGKAMYSVREATKEADFNWRKGEVHPRGGKKG